MKRAFAAVATTATVGAGVVLAASGPAAAGSPACTSFVNVQTRTPDNLWRPIVVPATNGGNTTCQLQQGYYNNTAVEILQITLHVCYGKDTGGSDGDFGPKTKAALQAVQRSHGITADGIYGPQTRDTIFHWGAGNT